MQVLRKLTSQEQRLCVEWEGIPKCYLVESVGRVSEMASLRGSKGAGRRPVAVRGGYVSQAAKPTGPFSLMVPRVLAGACQILAGSDAEA